MFLVYPNGEKVKAEIECPSCGNVHLELKMKHLKNSIQYVCCEHCGSEDYVIKNPKGYRAIIF